MILTETKRTISTNATETGAFTIAATREAFEALSGGIYSNRYEAIIRELSTNALDSHMKHGNPTRPFKVTFPTEWTDDLVLRDYGTGMTDDEIFHLYSTYFASDKRGTNDVTGAFGLGSKSPLSLVDSFTVRTRTPDSNDVRTYIVAIGSAGIPEVTSFGAVDALAVDFEPGTEVTIPTTDPRTESRKYRNAATDVYRYFPVAPETNFPLEIEPWQDSRRRLSDGLHYSVDYGEADAITVVQGPVGYNVQLSAIYNGANYPELDYRKHLTFEVPMGSVRPALSRETLSLDGPTRDYLKQRYEYLSSIYQRNERLRTIMTGEPTDVYRLGPDIYYERYGNPRDTVINGQQQLHYWTRRRIKTLTFERHADDKIYRKEANREGIIVRSIEDRETFFVSSDDASLFSRRMRKYLKQGKLPGESFAAIVGHPRALERLARTWDSHLYGPVPRHWHETDWPTLKEVRTSGRPATTKKNYYIFDVNEAGSLDNRRLADRYEIVDLLDAGKTLARRMDFFSLPETIQPSVDIVYELENRREERTKLYKDRIFPAARGTVLRLREEYRNDLDLSDRELFLGSVRSNLSLRTIEVLQIMKSSNEWNLLPAWIRYLDTLIRFPDGSDIQSIVPGSIRERARQAAIRIEKNFYSRYNRHILTHYRDTREDIIAYIVGVEFIRTSQVAGNPFT